LAVLDRFRVVLLDLNGTFMFGQDRFGPGEDFAATYRSVGGRALEPRQVERAIRACYRRLAAAYEDPARYDDFPQIADVLRTTALALPEEERGLLERVFALHELGTVPPAYAAFLRRLAATHALGLVANIWCGKDLWVQKLERAGVLGLFRSAVFSSDTASVKPSRVCCSSGRCGRSRWQGRRPCSWAIACGVTSRGRKRWGWRPCGSTRPARGTPPPTTS
jgi:putative hydrolase of the HAD superfamily